MKFKLYTIILILVLTFNLGYSQSINYVPSSAKMVISFNINSLINKLGKNYTEIIRDIIKTSGEKVSYIDGKLIEKLIGSLNLNEDIRIIMHDEENFSFVIPYRNITQLEEVIYECFESYYIRNYFSGNIKYFEIDQTTVMALGNNVLCVSFSESGTYVAYSYLKEIINNTSPMKDRAFLELEKKFNDMALWMDMDYLYKRGLLDEGYKMYNNNIFYKSSLSASLNFNQGYVTLDVEGYFPRSPFGKIKKRIDSNIAQLTDTYNILGFLSLSFNPIKFNEIIKNNFAYTEIDGELRREIDDGITGYDLIEIFGGDCSVIIINDNGNPKFIASISLKDKNKFINTFGVDGMSIRKIGNDKYWVELGEFNFYITDSIDYMCASDMSINRLINILNNRSNSDNYSRFASNNDISFFFNIDKSYKLFKKNSEWDMLISELHYISGSINIENNYSVKTSIRLNFKNSNQNSLATLMDILSRIDY